MCFSFQSFHANKQKKEGFTKEDSFKILFEFCSYGKDCCFRVEMCSFLGIVVSHGEDININGCGIFMNGVNNTMLGIDTP